MSQRSICCPRTAICKGFGSAGREGGERLAHPPAVDELGRLAGLTVRIARVGGVDGAERALQSIGHGDKGRRVAIPSSHARRSRKSPILSFSATCVLTHPPPHREERRRRGSKDASGIAPARRMLERPSRPLRDSSGRGGQPIPHPRRPPKGAGRCLARRSRYCRGPRRAPPEQRARGGRTKEWRATFA